MSSAVGLCCGTYAPAHYNIGVIHSERRDFAPPSSSTSAPSRRTRGARLKVHRNRYAGYLLCTNAAPAVRCSGITLYPLPLPAIRTQCSSGAAQSLEDMSALRRMHADILLL